MVGDRRAGKARGAHLLERDAGVTQEQFGKQSAREARAADDGDRDQARPKTAGWARVDGLDG